MLLPFQVRNILSHDVPEKKIVLGSINEIVSIVKDCPHEEVTCLFVVPKFSDLDFCCFDMEE